VRINQLFLAASRQWFVQYDPLVFVVSEFTYNTAVTTVPFVVGPSMMETYDQQIPLPSPHSPPSRASTMP
jgi:hypothetical protein